MSYYYSNLDASKLKGEMGEKSKENSAWFNARKMRRNWLLIKKFKINFVWMPEIFI